MTIEELRAMAARWGGDIARWPAHVQDAARAVAETAEGARVLEAERRLDAQLARRPDVSAARAQRASLAVLHRLAEAEAKPSWQASLVELARTWLLPTASVACSMALGVALALGGPSLLTPQPDLAPIGLILDSTSLLGSIDAR